MLGASYQLYYHAGTNQTILRTVGYALPAALHIPVKTIIPTTAFGSTWHLPQTPRNRSSGAAAEASGEPVDVLSRDINTSPWVLRWVYLMSTYTPAAADRNALGIVGFPNEYPSPNPEDPDLRSFMTRFRTDAIAPTVVVVPVDGSQDADLNQPNSLATMDAEYGEALVYPDPVVYYALSGPMQPQISPSGGPAPGDVYFEWLYSLTKQQDIPQTLSVGWRFDEQTISKQYADTLCLLFAELGARGTTVFAASGDAGVGVGGCRDSSGNVRFYTTFPASCKCGVQSFLYTNTGASCSWDSRNFAGPYVTSVGGTTSFGPEAGSSFSGGGFSNLYQAPEYQRDAVAAFLRREGPQLGYALDGLYKSVRSSGLTLPILNYVICAALQAAASPTSPLKRRDTDMCTGAEPS
jgi:tripeptidyl-peptidase-1